MAGAWSTNCCGWCRCRNGAAVKGVPGHAEPAMVAQPAASAGVAPTLEALIALRALAGARHPVGRGLVGMHGAAASSLRGRGMEYAESREYAAGDDARHIDWRLTARSGKPHTKLFQAERERLTLVVADTAPVLYFGTRVRFKSVQAARVGAVMAWLAARDGDRIAALRGSLREGPMPPLAGTRGALRVLDTLVRWYTRPPEEDAGLVTALTHALRVAGAGTRVCVLADPASVLAVADAQWAALGRRHRVHAVLLTDPLECEPPAITLPLAVAGGRLDVPLATARVRQRWLQVFAGTRDAALDMLRRHGIHGMVVSSEAGGEDWWRALATPRRGGAR